MTMTLTKAIQMELQKSLGAVGNISEEAITLSLQAGQLLAQGKIRLKDILNISDKHMEILYAVAYESYQKNKLEEADKIFTLLCTYDPIKAKYWEGLGATKKRLNKHEEAITAYFSLVQLRPLKISYYLDIAEEFIKMRQFKSAMHCCQAVEFMANDETYKPENKDAAICLQKATALHKALEKKL